LFRDCCREPNAFQKAVAINSLSTIRGKEKKQVWMLPGGIGKTYIIAYALVSA